MTIALVGAPGAGKTTVGRVLAQELGCQFIDVDHRIEQVLGKPIAEIFADEGEEYFRAVEESATVELLEISDAVVSLGGGAVMNPAIREALRTVDVVWLQVGITQATRRVGMNKVRPLLLGNVRAKLIELLRERSPLYEQVATVSIDTDQRDVADIVAEIKESIAC